MAGPGRPRLDPSTSDSPQVTVNLSIATRDRLTELAVSKGVSRAAAMRQLIEHALACLDEVAGQR